MRSGSGKGNGRSSTPYTTVKIAVLAPMPRASVKTATAVNPGFFASIRKAYRMSCQSVPMLRLPALRSDARFLCFLNDAAVEQMNGALGKIRVALVVGNHADGSPVAVQVAQQFHDGFAVLGVQVSGRLIGH